MADSPVCFRVAVPGDPTVCDAQTAVAQFDSGVASLALSKRHPRGTCCSCHLTSSHSVIFSRTTYTILG